MLFNLNTPNFIFKNILFFSNKNNVFCETIHNITNNVGKFIPVFSLIYSDIFLFAADYA